VTLVKLLAIAGVSSNRESTAQTGGSRGEFTRDTSQVSHVPALVLHEHVLLCQDQVETGCPVVPVEEGLTPLGPVSWGVLRPAEHTVHIGLLQETRPHVHNNSLAGRGRFLNQLEQVLNFGNVESVSL